MFKKAGVSLIAVSILFLSSPINAFAVIQSLNGQTGQNQTFANDSNIGINSTANIHSLVWTGTLPVLRGGTGASAFTNGSVPFISSGVFSEDSSNLFWDTSNQRLGIGTSSPEQRLHVDGSIQVDTPNQGVMLSPNGDIDLNQLNFLSPVGTSQIFESSDGDVTVSPGLFVANGCLVMNDSDGVGVTYVTANDGVLTASTTKPSNCQ